MNEGQRNMIRSPHFFKEIRFKLIEICCSLINSDRFFSSLSNTWSWAYEIGGWNSTFIKWLCNFSFGLLCEDISPRFVENWRGEVCKSIFRNILGLQFCRIFCILDEVSVTATERYCLMMTELIVALLLRSNYKCKYI